MRGWEGGYSRGCGVLGSPFLEEHGFGSCFEGDKPAFHDCGGGDVGIGRGMRVEYSWEIR